MALTVDPGPPGVSVSPGQFAGRRLHYNGAMMAAEPAPDLVDQLSTPLALLDAELRLLRLNPALQSLIGPGWRRLLAQSLCRLSPQEAALRQAARRCLDGEGPIRMLELTLDLPPGRQLAFPATLSRLHGPTPACLLLEGHGQRASEPSSDWLEGQSALTEVLKGFVHELRNPLGGIRGAAQILQRSARDAAALEFAGIIIDEVDRLGALVDRLLSPGTARTRERVNIHRLLERVRQLVEAEAEGRIRILRDYDPSLPRLQADPDRLLQALLNLMRNALQCGAATLLLRTRAEHQVRIGDRLHRLALRVEIIDDGPGIPGGLENTLFLPFVSGRAGGTGLGLPQARAAVHEHGGVLTATSRPGETCFTLLLPLPVDASRETGDG